MQYFDVIYNTGVSISHIPGEQDDKVDFRRKGQQQNLKRNLKNT
jgi:hypothetical protein